jgi:U3 small nucleolar RNA-associated protein 10
MFLKMSSIELQARLLLDPLIGTYEQSLSIGHEATTALFHMIAAVASRMDRSSVPLYHTKIFHVCLQALDLRSNRPSNFSSIAGVEKSVIEAFSSLSLKLSENSFKPLFINVIDWAQTSPVEDGGLSGTPLDRKISFFGLVHQLLEKLR